MSEPAQPISEEEYFERILSGKGPDNQQAELYMHFISLTAMTWLKLHIQNSENPSKILDLFIDHWKRHCWKRYNAGLATHNDMMQTNLGKRLATMVPDCEENRIKIRADIDSVENSIRSALGIQEGQQ